MRKITLTLSALFAFISFCQAQNAVEYTVSFPNYLHHEAEISMTVPQLPAGAVKVRMSRSSPGRYATHEFGKNIYNVKAKDESGKSLTINQVEGDVYEIPSHGKSLIISYTLFGNWVDGTYASIDASHAHLNIPASFMWMYGMDKRPVKVAFEGLNKLGWMVATQLKKEGENSFSAPNLQYFMDSPIEISTVKTASWQVSNPDGKKQTIHYTTHAPDAQTVVDNYAKMVQKLVLEQQAVFGELPKYDFGEYRFLQDVHPTNAGDGMEHRNSTSLVERNAKIEGEETDMLGTFSHEYFHSWNVERIRPKSLEPFNFSHANMSSELWFAEGFTQYYGPLLLVRSGFYTLERYEQELGTLVNQALNTPGAKKYSPAQMSRYAVFADAGVAVDQTNMANIFTSYYTYGAATALALELHLRSEFNLTLDDFMREVWKTHGKTEIPYTIPDLQKALARTTKNEKFAADFFNRYIYAAEKNDYKNLLAKAGFTLQKAQPGKAWLDDVRFRGENLNISNPTTQGSPLYLAGLDAGDTITELDGKAVSKPEELKSVLEAKKPGDSLEIGYSNRTGNHKATAKLIENPRFKVVALEKTGGKMSPQQEALRNKWLSSKVKN